MSTLPIISNQIPWDFKQANYSDLSSPSRPWLYINYPPNGYIDLNQTSYFPMERKFTPPAKRMRLQTPTDDQQAPPAMGSHSQNNITDKESKHFKGRLQYKPESMFFHISMGHNMNQIDNHLHNDGLYPWIIT